MKKQLYLVGLIVPLLLTNCRKIPNTEQLKSNLVVATNKAPGVNYKTYKTYFISDTIAYLSNTSSDSILVGSTADQLIDAVKNNMTKYGYTLVGKNQNPDLGIALAVTKDINVETYYAGWWDYYPGYWDPWYWYYPSYYPYYYPFSAIYTYTTGSIILNMIDLKNAVAEQKLTVVWNMAGLGAVGSSVSSNTQAGVDAINQGFNQASYLKTN